MSNEDGTVWLTFGGEIYNHRELRPELEAKGHVYRSQTDTETIVHLYEEEGPRCVERLNGMFHYAIWDTRSRELHLARDRLGKKPVYYAAARRAASSSAPRSRPSSPTPRSRRSSTRKRSSTT